MSFQTLATNTLSRNGEISGMCNGTSIFVSNCTIRKESKIHENKTGKDILDRVPYLGSRNSNAMFPSRYQFQAYESIPHHVLSYSPKTTPKSTATS